MKTAPCVDVSGRAMAEVIVAPSVAKNGEKHESEITIDETSCFVHSVHVLV